MKKYIIPIGILIIGFMIYRMLQTNNVTEPATEYELKPTAEQIHIPIDDVIYRFSNEKLSLYVF